MDKIYNIIEHKQQFFGGEQCNEPQYFLDLAAKASSDEKRLMYLRCYQSAIGQNIELVENKQAKEDRLLKSIGEYQAKRKQGRRSASSKRDRRRLLFRNLNLMDDTDEKSILQTTR